MMRFLRRRWAIVLLAVIVVSGIAMAASARTGGDDGVLLARATRGNFNVTVTVAGSLRAKSAVQIQPPPNSCSVGACTMKIAKILPEGSYVEKGDTVIELDRSPIVNYTNNINLALQKAQAVFEQAQLDTTLNLSKAREDLRTATTALEEKRIGKEQATYEAPSVRRQADIDYDKADRALKQQQADYSTRENQAKAKMREVSTDLQRNMNSMQLVKDVSALFTVTAPSDGMLIYTRDYSGKKRGLGAQFYYGEGALAELPDLRYMMSMTYVNEVDIKKVALGQTVTLTLDSDPSKRLTGKVVEVANVGEERPNSDGKVFEVRIDVTQTDTTLRPGMTTSNAIEVLAVENALSIPIEAIATEGDTPYIYKRGSGGVVKQQVETGAINDTHVIVIRGLEENDQVLLVPPLNHAALKPSMLPPKAGADSGDVPLRRSIPATTPPKDTTSPPKGRGGA